MNNSTTDIFLESFRVVVGHEGGYVNDPRDPGGETNYGISKRQYPDLNIKELTPLTAASIYRRDYWEKNRLWLYPAPIALVLFDTFVNGGRPIQWMQKAVRAVPDGIVGPQTRAALLSEVGTNGWQPVVMSILDQRLAYMASLPTWPVYGAGWARRCVKLAVECSIIDAA